MTSIGPSLLSDKLQDTAISVSRLRSVEKRLGDYFPLRTEDAESRPSFTDNDLHQISFLLRNSGRFSWSNVPRIYATLRVIGKLELLDEFIEHGITDIWFPFNANTLPITLSPSTRAKFLECQSVVLTKALDLEKGEQRKHVHFGKGEMLPYEVKAKLGSGGYGEVEKVISLISHREYARKRFRRSKNFLRAQKEVHDFLVELRILKRISHIHCVEMVGSYTDPTYFAILMSPVADYDLESYMTLATGSPDKQSLLRTFFGCLSFGLQYLHDSKIRHRDVKPRNILVKGDMVFWTDFGISLDWGDLSRSTTTADSAKTLLYCAPEVANYEPRNSSSDIWSLGCVFLEMATVLKGQKITDMRAEFEAETGNYRFYRNIENALQWVDRLRSLGKELDNAPLNWITKMLDLRPSSRPTAYALIGMITDEDPDDLGVSASFCGSCCLADPESPIGAESEGEAWIEKTARSEPSVTPLAYEPAQAEPHSHQAQDPRIGHLTQTEANVPVEHPLARDPDPGTGHTNVQGEQLGNALLAASFFEHDQIAQRQGLAHESASDKPKNVTKLIEGSKFQDAMVNHSTEDGSAIQVMMENEFGATAKDFDKALLWADGKGHEAVAQLLLEKGTDAETTEDHSFSEDHPDMSHAPDGALGFPLPPKLAEVAVLHASPSVEMPEGAQPSLQTPSFKRGLERFGFTKLPLKLSNGVHTDNPSSEQPTSLLKRKPTDGFSPGSPNAKRIARVNPNPLVEILPPSSSQSSWKSHQKPSRKEKHTSQEKYASHPNNLTDTITTNLYVLFIGTNPGLKTALTGHAYAHPTNLFWRLLHSSGITPILHKPSDTDRLPALYKLGNTNIVSRATKDASELSKEEMNAGVAILEQKISEKRPEAVCLVGKSIWEAIWRVKKGRNITKAEFKYGWQAEIDNMGIVKGRDGWGGARVFVGTTTSGLAVAMSKAEKERIWRELGVWVEKKRKEDENRKAEQ